MFCNYLGTYDFDVLECLCVDTPPEYSWSLSGRYVPRLNWSTHGGFWSRWGLVRRLSCWTLSWNALSRPVHSLSTTCFYSKSGSENAGRRGWSWSGSPTERGLRTLISHFSPVSTGGKSKNSALWLMLPETRTWSWQNYPAWVRPIWLVAWHWKCWKLQSWSAILLSLNTIQLDEGVVTGTPGALMVRFPASSPPGDRRDWLYAAEPSVGGVTHLTHLWA